MNPTAAGFNSLTGDFASLNDFVSSSTMLNWTDIFFTYRESINVFNNTIKMIPFDGDLFSMYYRTDVLEDFGLDVPRTWQEYNKVAQIVHNQTYKNTTLIGSCVGRKLGCPNYFWTNLILSSMTQYQGTTNGFLFDPLTMEPLTSEALEKTIEYLEGQVKYGAPDEFDYCSQDSTESSSPNIKWMNEGRCVLTYNWGGSFMAQKGSAIEGLLGVAPTPGSLYAYERDTKELVRCNEELCGKYGSYDKDHGWINQARYAAFGGWAGAANTRTSFEQKVETANFFSFISSIPESVSALQQEPFRQSQLIVSDYVDLGYPVNGTEQYFDTISSSLNSENTVVDIRFPGAQEMYRVYNEEVARYLEDILAGDPSARYLQSESRSSVVESITEQFNEIAAAFDSKSYYQSSLNYEAAPLILGSAEIEVIEETVAPVDTQLIIATVSILGCFGLLTFLYVTKVRGL